MYFPRVLFFNYFRLGKFNKSSWPQWINIRKEVGERQTNPKKQKKCKFGNMISIILNAVYSKSINSQVHANKLLEARLIFWLKCVCIRGGWYLLIWINAIKMKTKNKIKTLKEKKSIFMRVYIYLCINTTERECYWDKKIPFFLFKI